MLLVLGTAVFLVPLVSVLANAARQARHKQMKNELYAELADNVLGVSDWVFAGRGEEYLTRHKERELRMRDVQERMERFGRRRDVVLQALFGGGGRRLPRFHRAFERPADPRRGEAVRARARGAVRRAG